MRRSTYHGMLFPWKDAMVLVFRADSSVFWISLKRMGAGFAVVDIEEVDVDEDAADFAWLWVGVKAVGADQALTGEGTGVAAAAGEVFFCEAGRKSSKPRVRLASLIVASPGVTFGCGEVVGDGAIPFVGVDWMPAMARVDGAGVLSDTGALEAIFSFTTFSAPGIESLSVTLPQGAETIPPEGVFASIVFPHTEKS